MTQAVLDRPTGQERSFVRVQEIIQECGASESALIPILQRIQDEYRYLPEEILSYVATVLDISPATVCGVATFYAQFSLVPKGKHVVRVCDGTACHVRDNRALIESVRKRLKITGKQITSDDNMYTLEIVNCIGACALAPAVVVDEQVHGQMTGEKILKLFNQIDAKDKEAEK
ncbi:MAG: NAD(P)H-dependent oxidoreductase subunit E [Capsulimonadaceae bacterium]|nr:NAD(P)H-dependent oxidoreductase subunit E [Capsulimonadaceae bacterium]